MPAGSLKSGFTSGLIRTSLAVYVEKQVLQMLPSKLLRLASFGVGSPRLWVSAVSNISHFISFPQGRGLVFLTGSLCYSPPDLSTYFKMALQIRWCWLTVVMTALMNRSVTPYFHELITSTKHQQWKKGSRMQRSHLLSGYLFLPRVGLSNLSSPCHLPVFTFHFQLTKIRGNERFSFSVIIPTTCAVMTDTCS